MPHVPPFVDGFARRSCSLSTPVTLLNAGVSGEGVVRQRGLATTVLAALLVLLLAVASSKVAGQTCPNGNFFELDSWYVNANTQIIGILPESNGTELRVDRNGDGVITATDPVFAMPPPLQPPFLASATLRLSPTRNFLYAVGGQSLSGCSGTTVRFYSLPPATTGTPTLLHEACFPNIQRSRIFYDQRLLQQGSVLPGSGATIAAILHQPPIGDLTLTLFDLSRPGSAGRVDVPGLRIGVGDIRIAQGSQALYIQHDLNSFDPQGTDYTLVSLCTSTFGQVVNPGGGFPLQNVAGGPLNAAIIGAASGLATVSFTQNGGQYATLQVRDCCATTVPPTVATLALSISASPTTLRPGQNIIYTLDVANLGPADAIDVVVSSGVNFNTTFVSATAGGTLTGTTVRWNLPTLAAGRPPVRLTFTATAQCASADYFALVPQVRAQAQNAGVVFAGVPQPGPRVVIPSAAGLTLASTAVSDVPPPVRSGDTITLSLTVTNPSPDDHVGVRFTQPLSAFGQGVEFDSLISSSRPGLTQPTPASVSWQGDLPAGQSLLIVLRLRVSACLPVSMTDVFPFGSIAMVNSCGVNVLSASFGAGISFPIARDLRIALGIAPAVAGLIGPVSAEHQAVRLGAVLPIELIVENTAASAAIGVRMSMLLPVGLNVGPSPIAAPVPAGASYDAATRTLLFQGDVPGQTTIRIRLSATVTTPTPRIETVFQGGVGACISSRSRLVICPVPQVPAGAALFGLDRLDGVWLMELGVDTSPRPFFGPILDGSAGMDYVSGGAMWIAASTCVRFDPATLALDILPRGAINAAEGLIPIDIAIDQASGDVLVSGTVRSGFHAALVRSNPAATNVRQLITDSTTVAIAGSITTTASGGVAVCSLPSRVDSGNSSRGVLVPNIAGPSLDYGVVPAIANPSFTFGFTPPGVLRGVYPVAIAPMTTSIGAAGEPTELWTVFATQWVQGGIFNFLSATSVYTLARLDPVAGTITPTIDLLAGDVAVRFGQPPAVPSYPSPLVPLNLTIWGGGTGNVGTSIAPAPNGGVFVASRTDLWRVDAPLAGASAAAVTSLITPTSGGTVDLVAANISGITNVPCLADIAGGGGGGVGDGVVDGNDFIAFLNAFAAGDLTADVVGGGGVAPGDGIVDGSDFIAFINAFAAGC